MCEDLHKCITNIKKGQLEIDFSKTKISRKLKIKYSSLKINNLALEFWSLV